MEFKFYKNKKTGQLTTIFPKKKIPKEIDISHLEGFKIEDRKIRYLLEKLRL